MTTQTKQAHTKLNRKCLRCNRLFLSTTKVPMNCPDCSSSESIKFVDLDKKATKHTATPWKFKDVKEIYLGKGLNSGNHITEYKGIIGREDCGTICHSIAEDKETAYTNAQFILKAVNCHDELLEALKEIRDELDKLAINDRLLMTQKSTCYLYGQKIDQLITKAEGK